MTPERSFHEVKSKYQVYKYINKRVYVSISFTKLQNVLEDFIDI